MGPEIERQFRAIFDHVPLGVGLFDREGRAVLVNTHFAETFGFERDEPLGRSFLELTHPDDKHVGIDELREMLAGERELFSVEKRYVRKDGSTIWGEVTVSAFPGQEGPPELLIAMLKDVTAEHRAREALKASEERNRRIVDAMFDAVFVYDRDGRLVEANEAASQMIGLSKESLLSTPPRDRLDPETYALLEQCVERARSGDDFFVEGEIAGRRADGSTFPGEVRACLIHLEGESFVFAVLRDISERKAAERRIRESDELLRQAQKMEAVGRLAGGIAHDFNNLLMAISGFASILREDHPELEPVHEILGATERAAELTKQLLAFGRPQGLEPRPLDLDGSVDDLSRLLERVIGEDVQLDLQLGSSATVVLDPHQLGQILLNLAINARDAMQDGGRIRIRTATTRVDESEAAARGIHPGDYATLSCEDTGAGMDEETRHRIFEPFFTTKERGAGTGLGLSTVYGLVRQSGGDITVSSAPGEGTRFDLLFPASREPVASAGGREGEDEARGGNETILVVEDDEAVRRLTERILERFGYEVETAGSGEEALAICEAAGRGPNLLLSDVVMPGINGIDLAAKVTELYPGTKVLLVSGYGERDASAWQVLHKPYRPAQLALRLREILDD